jgi:hypothetical protein
MCTQQQLYGLFTDGSNWSGYRPQNRRPRNEMGAGDGVDNRNVPGMVGSWDFVRVSAFWTRFPIIFSLLIRMTYGPNDENKLFRLQRIPYSAPAECRLYFRMSVKHWTLWTPTDI